MRNRPKKVSDDDQDVHSLTTDGRYTYTPKGSHVRLVLPCKRGMGYVDREDGEEIKYDEPLWVTKTCIIAIAANKDHNVQIPPRVLENLKYLPGLGMTSQLIQSENAANAGHGDEIVVHHITPCDGDQVCSWTEPLRVGRVWHCTLHFKIVHAEPLSMVLTHATGGTCTPCDCTLICGMIGQYPALALYPNDFWRVPMKVLHAICTAQLVAHWVSPHGAQEPKALAVKGDAKCQICPPKHSKVPGITFNHVKQYMDHEKGDKHIKALATKGITVCLQDGKISLMDLICSRTALSKLGLEPTGGGTSLLPGMPGVPSI